MKRILVVEDEDAIRDFVIINLKRVGYEVEDASSGEESHCQCSQQAVSYQMLVFHSFGILSVVLMRVAKLCKKFVTRGSPVHKIRSFRTKFPCKSFVRHGFIATFTARSTLLLTFQVC